MAYHMRDQPPKKRATAKLRLIIQCHRRKATACTGEGERFEIVHPVHEGLVFNLGMSVIHSGHYVHDRLNRGGKEIWVWWQYTCR